MAKIMRLRSQTTRPADNTAYAAGDEVSNSATAGSVVRPVFDLSGFRNGRIYVAELDIAAATGNVVTSAGDFEVLIFRTDDAPAAVGDNVTSPIAAAVRAKAVAAFRFDDTGWTGPLGTVAAGTSQAQAVMATLVKPLATPVLNELWPNGNIFSLEDVKTKSLTAVIRTLAAWTPTGVINTIGLTLDIEAQ